LVVPDLARAQQVEASFLSEDAAGQAELEIDEAASSAGSVAWGVDPADRKEKACQVLHSVVKAWFVLP
jgi:hypothetical protein